MHFVNNVPFAVQLNIYYAFHNEHGYMVAEEVPEWLRAHSTEIVAMFGEPTSSNTVFVFNTEQDYTAFILRWS